MVWWAKETSYRHQTSDYIFVIHALLCPVSRVWYIFTRNYVILIHSVYLCINLAQKNEKTFSRVQLGLSLHTQNWDRDFSEFVIYIHPYFNFLKTLPLCIWIFKSVWPYDSDMPDLSQAVSPVHSVSLTSPLSTALSRKKQVQIHSLLHLSSWHPNSLCVLCSSLKIIERLV